MLTSDKNKLSNRLYTAAALLLACGTYLQAQVANYNFAQTTGTYTAVTGGTLLANASFDDAVIGPITIPAFTHNGTTHTQMWVSTNGFLTFGSAPAANNYTPLSSPAGYVGAVSPFGANLASGASGPTEVRYRTLGFQLIVQWTNVRRAGLSESFSFQVRMNRYTGVIQFIYGPITAGPAASELHQPEVGLRGPDNGFANNVKNRRAFGNHGWDHSQPGNANDSKMRFSSIAPATYWEPGQTYRFRNPGGGMGCEPPFVADTVITDCVANTFTITADVETIGDATNITVSTVPAGGTYANVGSGIYLLGPYAIGTVVTLNVTNNDDANCSEQITNITGAACDCNDVPDGPAQPGTSCNDGNACTAGDTWTAGCACVGTFQDADNDGVCNVDDTCPGTAAGAGVNTGGCSCAQVTVDDGVPCTLDLCTNGVVTHTLQDADGDGVCDANDTCPGTVSGQGVNTAGCSCDQVNSDDGNPCTQDVCVDGVVTHIDQDADADGVCDANDNCPGTATGTGVNTQGCSCAQVTVADADPCTLDACLSGVVTHTFQDFDNDGACDTNDSCPGIPGGIGDPCNDGLVNTKLDAIDATCTCVGRVCTTNINLVFQTDGISNTLWQLREQGTNRLAQSGGGIYPPSQGYGESTCLPTGCFYLVVTDDAGDGIIGGGYILKRANGDRLIDNRKNFSTGFISQIANGQGFCLPIGMDHLIFTSTDKLDWVTGEYLVASPNPAVSALWNAGNTPSEAISGYEFWFFNPNGGYSFRRFRSHSESDLFGPDNSSRACHMRVNNWAAANQIPSFQLMNVRVRGRINGVNNEWGPASRFKIDPVRAQCPLTKLEDIPGHTYFSCGKITPWGSGKYLYARPVSGATQYQWRFRIDAESFIAIRTTTTYFVQLNWITSPLQNGKTYQVEVRAFKNGAWCIDAATPANCGFVTPCFVPWGDVCDVTIDNTPMNSGQNLLQEEAPIGSLHMYPNPNRGDQLLVTMDALDPDVRTVSLEIFDLQGRQVSTRTVGVNEDGSLNSLLDLEGTMTNGVYLVNVTAGSKRFTERLVIQR